MFRAETFRAVPLLYASKLWRIDTHFSRSCCVAKNTILFKCAVVEVDLSGLDDFVLLNLQLLQRVVLFSVTLHDRLECLRRLVRVALVRCDGC